VSALVRSGGAADPGLFSPGGRAEEPADDLQILQQALRGYGRLTDTYTSGGVNFVVGSDPDGIRILIAHPGPDKLPRSVVGPRLYT
jgi:hypothetical protein